MLRKFNSQNKNWHYGKAQRILKEHIFYLFFLNLEHFFVKQKERFKYSIYYCTHCKILFHVLLEFSLRILELLKPQ